MSTLAISFGPTPPTPEEQHSIKFDLSRGPATIVLTRGRTEDCASWPISLESDGIAFDSFTTDSGEEVELLLGDLAIILVQTLAQVYACNAVDLDITHVWANAAHSEEINSVIPPTAQGVPVYGDGPTKKRKTARSLGEDVTRTDGYYKKLTMIVASGTGGTNCDTMVNLLITVLMTLYCTGLMPGSALASRAAEAVRPLSAWAGSQAAQALSVMAVPIKRLAHYFVSNDPYYDIIFWARKVNSMFPIVKLYDKDFQTKWSKLMSHKADAERFAALLENSNLKLGGTDQNEVFLRNYRSSFKDEMIESMKADTIQSFITLSSIVYFDRPFIKFLRYMDHWAVKTAGVAACAGATIIARIPQQAHDVVRSAVCGLIMKQIPPKGGWPLYYSESSNTLFTLDTYGKITFFTEADETIAIALLEKTLEKPVHKQTWYFQRKPETYLEEVGGAFVPYAKFTGTMRDYPRLFVVTGDSRNFVTHIENNTFGDIGDHEPPEMRRWWPWARKIKRIPE